MDSFDGSRRRDSRPPLPPTERRSPRDPEPLEQRLDRWMSTGRQLVEGVSGGRPGSRPTARRPEARPGGRGGFDGLGRWVEDRLDWLLDDSDDWREPWQDSESRRSEPVPPPEAPREARPVARRDGRRRPLDAVSRRGPAPSAPAPLDGADGDWPDDDAFSVQRWQRPTLPLRRPDPLQSELEERRRTADRGDEPPAPPGRALPRSSRRR